MELWTKRRAGKTHEMFDVWVKEAFTIGYPPQHVDDFFHQTTALTVLVMEELRCRTGERWIVFSRNEEKALLDFGQHFWGGKSRGDAIRFLEIIFARIHKNWHTPFAEVWIREDDANKSPLETDAPLRLAIRIDE